MVSLRWKNPCNATPSTAVWCSGLRVGLWIPWPRFEAAVLFLNLLVYPRARYFSETSLLTCTGIGWHGTGLRGNISDGSDSSQAWRELSLLEVAGQTLYIKHIQNSTHSGVKVWTMYISELFWPAYIKHGSRQFAFCTGKFPCCGHTKHPRTVVPHLRTAKTDEDLPNLACATWTRFLDLRNARIPPPFFFFHCLGDNTKSNDHNPSLDNTRSVYL